MALVAVLGIAVALQHAQQVVPVYAAARDLPSGVTLAAGDLAQVSVKLPAAQLRQYLRPAVGGRGYAGQVLVASVRKDTLLPAGILAASTADRNLVEQPLKVDAGDLPEGLRPGDHVQILAAYTQGSQQGTAQLLVSQAEVVRLLHDASGLGAAGQPIGVQVRMPADRSQTVVAAVATARIVVVKTQPGADTDQAAAPTVTTRTGR